MKPADADILARANAGAGPHRPATATLIADLCTCWLVCDCAAAPVVIGTLPESDRRHPGHAAFVRSRWPEAQP